MQKRQFLVLLVGAMSLFNYLEGQSKFSATLHFKPWMDLKRILVTYDNGKSKDVQVSSLDYTTTIRGDLYGRYACISVFYPDSTEKNRWFSNSFWIGEAPADISIVADSSGGDPFRNCILTNAYFLKDMGKGKLDTFELAEWTAFDFFIRSHFKGIPSDSEELELYTLGTQLRTKGLQFIRQNPNLYFSLWYFKNEMTTTRYIDTDSLMSFFYTVFPDSLRQTIEGKEALKTLEARVNTVKGMKAPDYTARDLAGRTISPQVNKGKFVLLDFWASWCGPCMEEMPLIRQLKTKYSGSRLAVISISLDNNRKKFDEALITNHMDWTQIFGNRDLGKIYNVSGIPAVFLIDPAGMIIYKNVEVIRVGVEKQDAHLERLFHILQNKMTGSIKN